MAIVDRDGSVYKLRGPNPIMKEQKDWSGSKFELINFENESVTVADSDNPIKKFNTDYNVIDIGEKLDLKKEVFDPVEKDKAFDTITEFMPEPIVEKPIVEQPVTNIPESLRQHEVSFYAVPAHEEVRVDELYGDEYKKTVYGSKLNFIGYIVEQTDMTLRFWTKQELDAKSIVYPQNREKRWWRIKEVEAKSGGYLMSALTSDITPDFSD